MPESPRWLVSKGKIEEAKKVLFKIRAQDEYPEQELREIQIAVDEEKVYSSCRLVVTKYVFRNHFKENNRIYRTMCKEIAAF